MRHFYYYFGGARTHGNKVPRQYAVRNNVTWQPHNPALRTDPLAYYSSVAQLAIQDFWQERER